MLGRKEKIIENEKGEKLKIEYGMLDEGDSSRAFLFIFGLGFSTLFLMVGIMSGSWMISIVASVVLFICIVGSVGSMTSKRIKKLSKREFRDEQIDELIG